MLIESDHSPSLLQSSLVIALVSLTALTFVSALCMTGCKAKQLSHRPKSKCNGLKETSSGSCIKSTDVEKNGDVHQNGRASGHDRALPEIPATASGVASTDDDDDEDEGHYDIISKNRRLASLTSALPATANTPNKKLPEVNLQPKRGNHPYEKVRGDPDTESATYAGIPDNFSSRGHADNVISITNQDFQSGRNLADLPANPLYAGVCEGDGASVDISPGTSCKITQPPVYSVVGARTSDRNRSKMVRDSMADPSATSSVTPPVPERCYEAKDYVDGLDDSSVSTTNGCDAGSWAAGGTSGRSAMGSSPGAVSSFWSTAGIGYPASSEPAVSADETGPTVVGGAAMHESNNETLAEAAAAEISETAKRVPNYSSLTARESLENLRRRQQMQQPQIVRQQLADIGAADFIEVDGTYDTINYDLIRPQGNVNSSSGAMPVMLDNPVYNNGSDLYAEINTAPSSSHSSTYARVGDLIGMSEQAPVPPSVDALQQLTHYVVANHDDGFADPGYSRVDRPRPRSAHITTASQPVFVPTTSSSRGRRSPVYAVISKPSRSSRGAESAVAAAETRPDVATSTPAANLYAQVARRGQHRRALSSEVSLVESRYAVDARTTELSNHSRFSASSHDEVDFLQNYYGYSSIDVEPAATGSRLTFLNADFRTGVVMDDHRSVADSESIFNDFDPNYERVGIPSVRPIPNDGSSRSFGVAREFVPSLDLDDRVVVGVSRNNYIDSSYRPMRTSPPLIREHIYQEVTSNNNSSNAQVLSNVSLHGASASGRVQQSTRSGGRSGMLSTDL